MRRHLAPILACAAFAAACARQPAIDTQQVLARLSRGPLPVTDPASSLWANAVEHPAALMVQDVTEPRLTTPGVGLVKVRALHDGATIVFRLEWEDATKDLIPETGKSSDAVAVQFPMQPGADVANPAMGEAGRAVEICYWKAVWQDDAERAASGRDRVAALYPQATSDHYPFQANKEAREEMERRYAPARAARNPIVERPNAGPVQQILAEGFGTSSVPPAQKATGRGVWRDARWTTTIARPLAGGERRSNLQPGQKTYVAFAVWDGAARHTGARKMRSGWIPLLVEAK
jgi:DMSO reductase family type II enzyme heme b subunit